MKKASSQSESSTKNSKKTSLNSDISPDLQKIANKLDIKLHKVNPTQHELKNSKIIRAEDIVFNTHYNLTKLQKLILLIISKLKLTEEEITGFLVEQESIPETEKEISKTVYSLVKDNIIEKKLIDSEYLYKPKIGFSGIKEQWDIIDRKFSKKAINRETIINSFFLPLRKTYNNIIKKLKQNNYSNYNNIFYPLDNPMSVRVNNKKCILFSSNDYLGLAKNPEVLKAAQIALQKCGNSTSGSRIMTGTLPLHIELEKAWADFKYSENALLFSSGYLTNISLVSSFSSDTIILFDSLVHACIIDGISLSKLRSLRFKHNDMTDLEKKLDSIKNIEHKVIIVEGIYSLDGDIAPIKKIVRLAKKHNALIVVDEAHSSGTLGKTGRGVIEHFDLNHDDIQFKMGTLGKAFGSQGGVIAGKNKIIDALKYSARSFLFSTSISAATVGGALKAFEIINKNQSLVTKLQKNANFLRKEISQMGFNIGKTESQIIPLIIESEEKLYALQNMLLEDGFFINAISYPAVPPKKSRLRISLSAVHTDNQIHMLLESLKKFGKKLNII